MPNTEEPCASCRNCGWNPITEDDPDASGYCKNEYTLHAGYNFDLAQMRHTCPLFEPYNKKPSLFNEYGNPNEALRTFLDSREDAMRDFLKIHQPTIMEARAIGHFSHACAISDYILRKQSEKRKSERISNE